MKFPVSEYLYAVNEILKRNDTKYIYTHIYIYGLFVIWFLEK